MIVTCERCSTQFQLDDSRVPKRGVNVRCSRCKHAFRVLPESERAGESGSHPARRARGESDTKEITQDIPQSPGDSRSQSGERRRAKERAAAPREPAEPSLSSSGETEESDWRFNDESHTNLRGGVMEEKPEPPEAPAPSRNSRLGNEWFSGSGDDAPLELDNRGYVAPEDPPAVEAPAETPVVSARSGLDLDAPPPPSSYSPPTLASEPDPEPEPSFDTSFDGDLGSLGTSRASEPAPAPPQAEHRAASDPSDELGGDAWDLLAAAAEEEPRGESAPAPVKAPRGPRFQLHIGAAVARVVAWVGHVGSAAGWLAAIGLFGYGLHRGLAPVQAAEATPQRVAGLEVAELGSRRVENVSQGPLFVVSGRVRNPGPAAIDLRSLALELLDQQGEPLQAPRVALHAPLARTQLREATTLTGLPPLGGSVRSGEERSFEAVLTSLPAGAVSYRLVADASGAQP